MRIFDNYKNLSLTLLVLLVMIHASWTVELKNTENLLHNVFQQQTNNQHWKNPSATANGIRENRLRSLKPIDDRISDVIAENVLQFGHNLGLELAALDPLSTKSEIFSPLSIMAALSLLTLGAKGRSYQELKQLIGLDSDTELIENPSKYHEEFGLMLDDLQHTDVNNKENNGVRKRPNTNWRETPIRMAPVRSTNSKKPIVEHIIKVANGLFVQSGYSLNPDYSQVLKSIYETEFTTLDFQTKSNDARDFINNWVDKATFGKIPQIINEDIDKSTNIIMASVLYFKAFWETPFFPKSTLEEYFYPDGIGATPIKVKMMPAGGIFPYYNAKEYDCRIIGLPYKGNETTMYVIQPNNSSRKKLRELQQTLTAYKINNMIDKMLRNTTVMVFPKMHFTRSINLKAILNNMNIHDIFLNGYSDLSLIGGKPSYAEVAAAPPPPPRAAAPTTAPIQFATERSTVSYESIFRKTPAYQKVNFNDRFNEPALIFRSRFGEIEESENKTTSTKLHKVESLAANIDTDHHSETSTINSESDRKKRQVPLYNSDPITNALQNLESDRLKIDSYRSDLYVDDIIHKVDFSVDEQGTEAAAATVTYLQRSGTDVIFRGDTPFLILIRHDPTKLPLFYGIINKPEL